MELPALAALPVERLLRYHDDVGHAHEAELCRRCEAEIHVDLVDREQQRGNLPSELVLQLLDAELVHPDRAW